MPQREQSVEHAKQQAKQATRNASPWIEPLGRLGFAAQGVVYIVVGVLAAMAAAGRGGETTDTRGALQQILDAPFGKVLLAVVAVGLFGYALWRWVQALLDTDNKGSDTKGHLIRAGYALVGVVYLGLAVSAVQLVLGSAGQGGNTEQQWTARLLAQPFGRWLVGLVGVAVICVGGYQLYAAYAAKFREHLKLGQMSRTEDVWATRSGRFGFAARGIVFGIIGSLLVAAARHSNAGEAGGLGEALQTLAGQRYGAVLLGLVAFGLIAYGAFCLVEARYRRMLLS